MLTLTPASTGLPLKHPPRLGLALAGGGPLGAIYELGALQALDEALDGARLHELDAYVGVSSGAFISAGLANRINTTEICRIFTGAGNAEFRFRPEDFLRPAFREYLARAGKLPGAVIGIIREAITHPTRIAQLESLGGLGSLIPTGLFDNRSIESFLKRALSKPGRSDDFRELDTRLRIVAVELDSGQAVRFGAPDCDHVPISKAVQASTALPGLYPPVEIEGRFYVDGALRRTLHASAILRDGLDLLIGINPLVPFDSKAMKAGSRVTGGGLPLVLSQTFRALIQSRMQIGMGGYTAQYPKTSLLLAEPNRDDKRIFFTNVFSYSDRNRLADHAYRTTRAELLARADEVDGLFEAYGLGLKRDVLRRADSLDESLERAPAFLAPVSGSLARTLERLDRVLVGQADS